MMFLQKLLVDIRNSVCDVLNRHGDQYENDAPQVFRVDDGRDGRRP